MLEATKVLEMVKSRDLGVDANFSFTDKAGARQTTTFIKPVTEAGIAFFTQHVNESFTVGSNSYTISAKRNLRTGEMNVAAFKSTMKTGDDAVALL